MSLALASFSAAPLLPPSARTAERGGDQKTQASGSFGEALSRASQTADEPAAKPRDKAGAHPTIRRQGGPTKELKESAEPDLVANLALLALDARPPAQPLEGAAALGNDAKQAAADGSLAQALAGAFLPAQDATALPGTDIDPDAPTEAALDAVQPELLSMTLDVPSLKSPALRSPDQPVAGVPDGKAVPAPAAVLPAPIQSVAAPAGPAEPALVKALSAPDAKERPRPFLNTPKDTAFRVATSDTPPTAVPRTALDLLTATSPALRASELQAAGTLEEKVGLGSSSVLPTTARDLTAPAGSETQPRLEALLADLSTVSLAQPVSSVEAGAITSLFMPAPQTQAPANGEGSTLLPPSVLVPSSLPQDLGSREWGTALGQQLLQMGQAKLETAELQLNPPGLGPLKITLSINEHQIQAAFISAHASVRAAVEAALPQLRATMADNGISLGQASVGSENRQPADAGNGQQGHPGQRSYPGNRAREFADGPLLATLDARPQGSGGRVDLYA